MYSKVLLKGSVIALNEKHFVSFLKVIIYTYYIVLNFPSYEF